MVLDRLESREPQRRLVGKRAKLAPFRDRLIALRTKGYTWKALADELSAAGDKVTTELVRSICITKSKRSGGRLQRGRPATQAKRHDGGAALAPDRTEREVSSGDPPGARKEQRFGAKGLKA
jgi:hypothetical protein